MNMDIFRIIGFAIVAAVLCILLRQYKPEYALLVSVAAGAVILAMLISDLQTVFDEINMLANSGIIQQEYINLLLKAMGICFVTQIASDVCKDAGESAISSKLEIAGKITVLSISLPLFRQVLMFVSTLIG